VIGGGSTPDQSIATSLVVVAVRSVSKAERELRNADTPVIARIAEGKLVVDLRTVFPGEEPLLVAAIEGVIQAQAS
jgi:L-seryl-tRNA(Ser) seleniumtransferase